MAVIEPPGVNNSRFTFPTSGSAQGRGTRHELKTPSNGGSIPLSQGVGTCGLAMTERGWHHIAPVASSAATWEIVSFPLDAWGRPGPQG